MNTKLLIKNFRVFDENGVSIDIKPLTILTGCNSSGKSSIVKAAFLLNSFMKQVNTAIEKGEKIELSKYKLDFTQYPNNLLGRFDKVIPDGSSSHKITLGYSVYSYMLSKDVDVELVFEEDKNDDLNNAYLTRISMATDEGVFFSSDKEEGNACNLNIIRKYFPDFLKIEYLIDNYCDLCSTYCYSFEETISDEEFKEQQTKIFDYLHGFDRKRVIDVANYIRQKKGSYSSIGSKKKLPLLDWTEENNSYFNIPVLDYLSSINKEDIKTVIKEEIISDKGSDALAVPAEAILLASNIVVDAYVNSNYSSFKEFFREYEHHYFENITSKDKKGCPSMLSVKLSQKYTSSCPGRSGIHFNAVSLMDEPKEKKSEEEKARIAQERINKWESQPLTFDILYEVVMLWNENYYQDNNDYYDEGQDVKAGSKTLFGYPDGFHHHVFEMLTVFAKHLAEEVIEHTDFDNMSYVSSARASVEKIYDLNKKDDFTELLQRYFEKKRLFKEKSSIRSSNTPDYTIDSFMNYWLKQFGIGESLSFKLDQDGVGVKLYLRKNAESKERLLADEGYGITQLISVLLQIETAILSATGAKMNTFAGLSDFDEYDIDIFHFEENTIAIEEPEIHLHPSYQSKLAEMFVEAYSKYNIHFIIETHSEYLIRKLQTLAAKKQVNADDISIQYVYSPKIEQRPLYVPQVKAINVKADGRLTDSFGSGFFDEADNAAMELLTLKEQNL